MKKQTKKAATKDWTLFSFRVHTRDKQLIALMDRLMATMKDSVKILCDNSATAYRFDQPSPTCGPGEKC
jgi:hypothetical protein